MEPHRAHSCSRSRTLTMQTSEMCERKGCTKLNNPRAPISLNCSSDEVPFRSSKSSVISRCWSRSLKLWPRYARGAFAALCAWTMNENAAGLCMRILHATPRN